MVTGRSAKIRFTGLRAWWVQRVSAIYMLLFGVFLLVTLGLQPMHAYPQWRAWLTQPAMTLASLVFFFALLAHRWVGLRDVLLDYAKPARVRSGLLLAVASILVGLGVWTVAIMLRLHG